MSIEDLDLATYCKLRRLIEDEKYGTMENLRACSIAKYRNREKRNSGRIDGIRNVTIEAVAEEIGIPTLTLYDWLAEDLTNRLLRTHYISYQKARELKARALHTEIMIHDNPNYKENLSLPPYYRLINTNDIYGYEVVEGSTVDPKYDSLMHVVMMDGRSIGFPYIPFDGKFKWGKDYNTVIHATSNEPVWTGLCMRKFGLYEHVENNLDKYYDLPLTHEESELVERKRGFRAYLDRDSVLSKKEEKLDDRKDMNND